MLSTHTCANDCSTVDVVLITADVVFVAQVVLNIGAFICTHLRARMSAVTACYASCGTAWVACYAAAGLVAGTITAGGLAPAGALACNAAEGHCMMACTSAGNLTLAASVAATALAAMYRKHRARHTSKL